MTRHDKVTIFEVSINFILWILNMILYFITKDVSNAFYAITFLILFEGSTHDKI